MGKLEKLPVQETFSAIPCHLIDESNPEISGFARPEVTKAQLIAPVEIPELPIEPELEDKALAYEEFLQGIQGMSITAPVLGRIALGKVYVTESGKLVPKKEDFFTINSLVKNNEGEWVPHPLHDQIANANGDANKKIRVIPIKLMHDSVDLVLQDGFACYDVDSRLVCAGNGNTAKRVDADGHVMLTTCPGSTYCEFGRERNCKQIGRFSPQIEGQDDMFSTFKLRTAGWNSINNLRSKLNSIKSSFGYLSNIPLNLVIRTACSAQSFWTPYYFADIVIAKTPQELAEKKIRADADRKLLKDAGFDFEKSEALYRYMMQRGKFFEGIEDEQDMFEEHFSFLGSTEADSVGKTAGAHASTGNGKSAATIPLPGKSTGMDALVKVTENHACASADGLLNGTVPGGDTKKAKRRGRPTNAEVALRSQNSTGLNAT
jgi:hypothetical protein